MIDLKMFMYSLKATWLRRMTTSNNKYFMLVEKSIPFLNDILKFGTDFTKAKINAELNPFWKDVIFSYQYISLKMKIKNPRNVYTMNLWYNPNIKMGNKSVHLKRWSEKAILYVGDLINQEGEFYTFNEFEQKFRIRTNFLEYRGMINAIKTHLDCHNLDLPKNFKFNVHIPNTLALIMKDNKGCRSIYQTIKCNENDLPTSIEKWMRDLGNDINNNFFNSKNVFGHIFKLTNDPRLCWFQFRLNHRILATNSLLKSMNIVNDESCTFCRTERETLTHLFFDCDHIKSFWVEVFNHISNTCNIQLQPWKKAEVIFGNFTLDESINKIIMKGKQHIYYCRMKNMRPEIANFKKYLCTSYNIEKYAAKQLMHTERLDKSYERYKNLFEN